MLPVRVTRWDRATARAGMLCAPLAGLVVGLLAAALGALLLLAGPGPLLAAVASAAVPAALTRGLHLDGLADTADGLGSGKPAEDALRIMKQSDIGPFGVITLLLVLLAQVAALFELYGEGWAHGARRGRRRGRRRPARPHPGRAVRASPRPARRASARWSRARSRRGRALLAAALTVVAVRGRRGAACSARTARCTTRWRCWPPSPPPNCCCATAYARFGGVTGDVFGGLAETAATAALVVLTLGP